jgi:putative membrane protein
MTKMKDAVGLTNAFITLPKAQYMLLAIALCGIFFGALATVAGIGGYRFPDSILQGTIDGFFLLSIPAILTALIAKMMMRKMPFRRILASAFIGQMVYAVAYLAFGILQNAGVPNREAVLFIGGSVAFAIWFVIARLVFTMKWRAFLFSAIQLLLYGVFLATGKLLSVSGSPATILLKFAIASGVLLTFVYMFFRIINAPMKQNFGIGTLDAVSLFLAHWFYESKDIEGEFERVGEEAETELAAFMFRRGDETRAMVIPYVHFGPFGSLGGSNFSHLVSDGIAERHGIKSMVFHGTVTHDLNPVSSSELSKILDSFDEGLKGAEFSKCPIALLRGRSGECFAEALSFGKDATFVGVSRAPETTEDINFGLGLAMMAAGEKYSKMVAIADQHNSETGDITSFEPGTSEGYRYMDAVTDALSKATDAGKAKQFSAGFCDIAPEGISQIGPAGIKVAVFSTAPAYAIILIDSNGVTPETREKICECAKSAGKKAGLELEVGVFTTDTHSINRVRGVLNPLGSDEKTMAEIAGAVENAVADMKPCTAASFKRRFKINVLGAKQSIEIVSTVNAVVAVAKVAAPIVVIGSVVSLLWIISQI